MTLRDDQVKQNMAHTATPIDTIESRDLRDQVCHDMLAYLGSGKEFRRRLHYFSTKTELSKRTISRILQKANKPAYATVLSVYKFLLNTDEDHHVLEKAPPVVGEFLSQAYPSKNSSLQHRGNSSSRLLNENSIALALYIQALSGNLHTDQVLGQFGQYGLQLVDRLTSERLIREVAPGRYSEGVKKIHFTPELVIRSGGIAIEAFAKPKNGYEIGKHFAGFFADQISEETYKKWQDIDHEAFKRKVELAESDAGKRTIPAFTFAISETTAQEEGENDL